MIYQYLYPYHEELVSAIIVLYRCYSGHLFKGAAHSSRIHIFAASPVVILAFYNSLCITVFKCQYSFVELDSIVKFYCTFHG